MVHDDPVTAAGAELVGGPLGRHARTGVSWWTPIRVLVACTVVICLLGWFEKAPCRTHVWANDYQYTHACYSDVFALYFSEDLNKGQRPYLDHAVEYPVVTGGLMALAAKMAHAFSPADRAARFFDITAALLAVCAIVVVVGTALLAGRRRWWDAALVALSPVLVLHAYTNWDLAAVAAATLALLCWARNRPLLAGLFLGVGVATKFYPLLFLAPLFVLCLRAGRLRAWGRLLAGGLVAWLVIDVPIWLAAPSAFGRFYSGNRTRGADWDSLWYMVEQARGKALDQHVSAHGSPTILNTAVGVLVVLGVLAVAWLTLTAARRPRLPQVLFLTVVAFLLANKVYSPQYDLWVLPLAVLAYPRWRPILAWQAAAAGLLVARFFMFIGLPGDHPADGIGASWFFAAVALRDALLIVLAAFVVRDIRNPSRDVVRQVEGDDPAGGVLDGAPDARYPGNLLRRKAMSPA